MIIDIGVTVWNRPGYTENFLKSIVESNMKNYRLFILDQNSNEETRRIIHKYAGVKENFFHMRIDQNLGACGGRVLLYKAMISDYVILTDNDIIIPKQYNLNDQQKVLDKHQNVQCVVPRPTTAGPKSLVGKCMEFSDFGENLNEIQVSGTLMMMHRRENLLSANAYVLPGRNRWDAYEHILSKHYIASGWKYVCMMNRWVDVQAADETWGYDANDIVDYKDKYDKHNRIWDDRPVIANERSLEPKWSVDKIEAWDKNKEYVR